MSPALAGRLFTTSTSWEAPVWVWVASKINTDDKTTQKITSLEQQQRLDRLKVERFKQTIFNILVVSGYLLFALCMFAIIAFGILCLILYIMGNNSFASTVLTVFQVLTGICSLAVGIWALYLTIKANDLKSKSNQSNVFKSSINEKIEMKNKEDDVNEGSL